MSCSLCGGVIHHEFDCDIMIERDAMALVAPVMGITVHAAKYWLKYHREWILKRVDLKLKLSQMARRNIVLVPLEIRKQIYESH